MPTRRSRRRCSPRRATAAYPDGTFTLRLSYGQVKGYMENGKQVTPFTEIRGLFVRGDEHKQQAALQDRRLVDEGARPR